MIKDYLFIFIIFMVLILVFGLIFFYLLNKTKNNESNKKVVNLFNKSHTFIQNSGYTHEFDTKIELILFIKNKKFKLVNSFDKRTLNGNFEINNNIITLYDINNTQIGILSPSGNLNVIDSKKNQALYTIIQNQPSTIHKKYNIISS